jgi:hypothetical protein
MSALLATPSHLTVAIVAELSHGPRVAALLRKVLGVSPPRTFQFQYLR